MRLAFLKIANPSSRYRARFFRIFQIIFGVGSNPRSSLLNMSGFRVYLIIALSPVGISMYFSTNFKAFSYRGSLKDKIILYRIGPICKGAFHRY